LQGFFYAAAPGYAEFGVDVDEIEAGVDTGDEIGDGCAGAAVEGEEGAGGGFDLADAIDLDVFVLFAGEHGFQHAVHGADAGGEEVDFGGVDELLGLFGGGERVEIGGRGIVDGRRGADEAEFGFDEDIGIDGFQGFDGLLGGFDIFFEGELGGVEDDEIETGFGGLDGFF